MIIELCCIIFITYISICGLLTYYFIKQRKIWDKLFTLDAISQTIDDFITNCFIEMFVCPEHFIIWIPNMIMENTSCVARRKEAITLRAKVKVLLDTLKNNISILQDNKHVLGINKNNKNTLKRLKWILEGTTKEFYTVYNEPSNIYYKLIESYDILDKGNNKEEKKEKEVKEEKDEENNKDDKLSLDDLYVLENELEVCENILNIINSSDIMKTLEHNCYNKDKCKVKCEDNNSYILALMYDIIDCIRLKKINSSRTIYQMNNE